MLNGELYAQGLQKLIYLYLFKDCFMKISLQSSQQIIVIIVISIYQVYYEDPQCVEKHTETSPKHTVSNKIHTGTLIYSLVCWKSFYLQDNAFLVESRCTVLDGSLGFRCYSQCGVLGFVTVATKSALPTTQHAST